MVVFEDYQQHAQAGANVRPVATVDWQIMRPLSTTTTDSYSYSATGDRSPVTI